MSTRLPWRHTQSNNNQQCWLTIEKKNREKTMIFWQNIECQNLKKVNEVDFYKKKTVL